MEKTDSTSLKLKALREGVGVGLREMARRTGMSTSTYAHYENPSRFKDEYLPLKMAQIFGEALRAEGVEEQIFQLAGLDGRQPEVGGSSKIQETGDGDISLVPVYNVTASAGFGSFVGDEDHVCDLAFERSFLKTMTFVKSDELGVIQVKGDSMEPTLLDGDQVLVDRSKINLDYDGLFVIRYGEALHVKRVGRAAKRNHIFIRSDNDQYLPIEVEMSDLDVVGRVLWYGRKV